MPRFPNSPLFFQLGKPKKWLIFQMDGFFFCGNHSKIFQVQQSESAAQNEVMLWDDLFGGRGFGEVFLVQWFSPNSPSSGTSIKFPPKLSAAFPDSNPRAAPKRAGTESMKIHRDVEWVGWEGP